MLSSLTHFANYIARETFIILQQRAEQFLNPLKERELHLRGQSNQLTVHATKLFLQHCVETPP
jgi:hypothetical protein